MPGTVELPVFPEEAIVLSPRLAVVETSETPIFMNGSGPLMSCARQDAMSKRYLGAVLLAQGLANGEELAAVLGVHGRGGLGNSDSRISGSLAPSNGCGSGPNDLVPEKWTP